jgi:hypothetical protein
MAHRNPRSATISALPALTTGEWRDVQAALRQVHGTGCARGERPGPIVRGPISRGLAKISQFVTHRPVQTVPAELQPVRDFLCESARHGPAVAVLAERLHDGGFSDAQIAALSIPAVRAWSAGRCGLPAARRFRSLSAICPNAAWACRAALRRRKWGNMLS